jgi:hypothetical protein
MEDALPSLDEDRGRIPVFYQEAIAPDSGNFDWIDFYERTLEDINEPLIEYKVDLDFHAKNKPKERTKRALRKSVEQALIHRRPAAFLIDEAQHLTKLVSGRILLNQLDTIKSLSSKSKVPHVLIGTYETLKFRNLSGQLSRRGSDIHFERYRIEKEEHKDAFISILWSFQKHIPLRKEPNLVDYWDFFYERSIGCVGILKNWLNRVLRVKLQAGNEKLDIDDFRAFAHTLDECIKMAKEARDGELQLEESHEKQLELQTLLGIGRETQLETDSKKSKKKNNKVGERNPKRDKVGEAMNS